MDSEAASAFFKAEVEGSPEVFVFDGFKLSLIGRETELVRGKVPVTEGNYFVLFFVKDDHVPEVKVLRAGEQDIDLGKIVLDKIEEADRGFLTGVVYKAVSGGKISPRKGVLKLIAGLAIRVAREGGRSYLTKSSDDGTYSISLKPGKYKMFVGNGKEAIDIRIEKGKTTIQNLQRGVMLID